MSELNKTSLPSLMEATKLTVVNANEEVPAAPAPAPKKETSKKTYSEFEMDVILQQEKKRNTTESWTRIDNTQKRQKIIQFAEKYSADQHFTPSESEIFRQFLLKSFENGKLNKTKNVQYDKATKEVVFIPNIIYDKGEYKLFDQTRKSHSSTQVNSDGIHREPKATTLKNLKAIEKS
jgi:hypothetical protein